MEPEGPVAISNCRRDLSQDGRTILCRHFLDHFELVEIECNGNLVLPMHCHERGYLYIVLTGSQVKTTTRDRYSRHTGEVGLVWPDQMHADEYLQTPTRTFCISVPFEEAGWERLPPNATNLAAHPCSDAFVRLYREVRRIHGHDTLQLESLGWCVLDHLFAKSLEVEHGCSWLRRVRDRLHEEPLDTPRLGDLADDAGVHQSHLARSFKSQYGRTIGDYARRLRIQIAMDWLVSTNEPLAYLAHDLGFFDQAHFCHVFKKHTGCTPAEYQRMLRD